jgi:hypothetical protein
MNLTIGTVLDQLRRIGWPWPEGTDLGALVDPCRDGWVLRLTWGLRSVEVFVSYESIFRGRYWQGRVAVFVRAVDGLTKALRREVGGCGLAPIAASDLEGLVPT